MLHTLFSQSKVKVYFLNLILTSSSLCCCFKHLSLEPPNIIEFPELLCTNSSLVVYTSAPARLVCSAVGNPLPTVQWFLDSVPLITEGGGLQEVSTYMYVMHCIRRVLCSNVRVYSLKTR